jgi:hypothetical protein
MIDASIKQAMKEARQKRKQEDKARIDAQHAWRKPAKEAAAAERRKMVDAAISERRTFELKYADVGIVKRVSAAKIKKRLKPKSRPAAKIKAEVRWRRKNQDYVNARQRERYAARKAARKEKESIIK